MPSALAYMFFDPLFGLVMFAALLPLTFALLWVWRRDALRNAQNPERYPWFGFAIRVQVLTLTAWFAGPSVTSMSRPAQSVGLLIPELASLEPLLGILMLGVLPIGITLIAVIVADDVERRLRGSGMTLRERLSNTGFGLSVIFLALTGLVAANVMISAGNVRGAVGCALTGCMGALWLAGRRAAVLGLKPEAETSGPLRDRLFELAAHARVKLRQVYVLAASRMKMANAFAVRGGNVLLTDHLLAHLSRREVEAVIAHELAHLQQHHPQKYGLAFGVPFGAFLALSGLVLEPYLRWPEQVRFPLAGLLGGLTFVWWTRRFEFQADRGAVRLTGDAPALITALVRISRLNHMPVDWSPGLEWILTHPSVRRRALALASSGHLSEEDANRLVDDPPDDPERWATRPAAREPVFGTTARLTRITATTWSLLLASTVTPTVVFVLLGAGGVHMNWLQTLTLGAVVSLTATLVVVDLLATAGYAGWQREIAERSRRAMDAPGFVGLSPGEGNMTYEGFADWDLGYLDLDPVALRFEGERARFALERERIASIELVQGLPGWFPAPRVAIRWRAADGVVHPFTVRDGRARKLHQIAGRSRALLDTLRQWHAQPAPVGVRPLTIADPPRPDAVTGIPCWELASPRTLFQVAAPLAAIALLAALAAGLPLVPGHGPGAFELIGAGLATLLLLRLPLWWAGRSQRRSRPALAAGGRAQGDPPAA